MATTPQAVPQEPAAQPQAVAPEPSAAPAAPTDRQRLYQQYDEGNRAPADPVPEPVAAAPAEPPAEPAVPALTTEQVLAQIAERLGSLEQRLQQPAAPANPAPPTTPAAPVPTWVDHLAQGNVDLATETFAEVIMSKIQPRLAQTTASEAAAAVRAEQEIAKFNAEVRSGNQDLQQLFGSQIDALVKLQMQDKINSGAIKDYASYITEYKTVTNGIVKHFKDSLLKIRGEGRTAGMTTRSEVISTTLPPNPPNDIQRGQPAAPSAPPVVDPIDYLARRQAAHERGRGLTLTTQ